MITNEIDAFRKQFFANLIQEEKEKEAQLKLKQSNCFHCYKESIDSYGYPCRMCSKCEHSTYQKLNTLVKSIPPKKEKADCVIA